MVRAVSETLSTKIILLSDDDVIKSSIKSDPNLVDCSFLFTVQENDFFNQLKDQIPQVAIIDSSCKSQNIIEITWKLKERFKIPIILLIEPDNLSHLEQATWTTVNSVLSKPLQFEQLAVSIQFHLLEMKAG